MEMRFTPGPWGYVECGAIGKPFTIFADLPGGHREYVCVLQNVHYATHRNEPNARLIAQAPTMHELLCRGIDGDTLARENGEQTISDEFRAEILAVVDAL